MMHVNNALFIHYIAQKNQIDTVDICFVAYNFFFL